MVLNFFFVKMKLMNLRQRGLVMKNKIYIFWAIVVLVIACLVLIFTKPTKLGLDLVGGSRLVIEAQTTDTIGKITPEIIDRKSTRLNSSHQIISYAVFC